MSKTPHTAGPWKAKGHYINTDQGKDSICIAQVNNGAERFDEHPEELEANALILAAAPDLLAAAQMAYDAWTMPSEEFTKKYPTYAYSRSFDAVETVLHMAIQKAKGEPA